MNSTTVTHFFKIILKETLENNKLKIPTKFVRKYGYGLSNSILVKLPCGPEWRLGLTKCDGKLWIDKGWLEFSKHYSLAFGHLLVFRYEGNSKFNVVLFDTTTTEIEYYPSLSRHNNDIGKEKEDYTNDDDDYVEILDDFSPPHELTEEKPLSRPNKRMRSIPFKEDKPSRGRLTAVEFEQALERAKGFESEHPFFMCVMQPTTVEHAFTLSVPVKYAKAHMPCCCKTVILKDPQGKEWSAQLQMKNYNGNYLRVSVQSGWKAFALGNNLQRADLCVFVQINKSIESVVTFEISIYRVNGTVNSAPLPSSSSGKSSVHKAERPRARPSKGRSLVAKSVPVEPRRKMSHGDQATTSRSIAYEYNPTSPHFQVDFSLTSFDKDTLQVPIWFGEKYLEKRPETVRLEVGERFWEVKLNVYPQMYRFSEGWFSFATDNSLAPGDTCIMELVEKKPLVFKVSIFGKTH